MSELAQHYSRAEFLQHANAFETAESSAPMSRGAFAGGLEALMRAQYADSREVDYKFERCMAILQFVEVHMTEFAYAPMAADVGRDPQILGKHVIQLILCAAHEAHCLAPVALRAKPVPQRVWARVREMYEVDQRAP